MRAEGVLPGGVLGRHRYPRDVHHVPYSGRGARIYDIEGREYIDYSLGGGSLLLGYSHPRTVAAITDQVQRATQFVSISNMPAIELAERIKQLVSWIELVRFALSGSEAVMFALRLARAATGRDKILKFEGAYHGNTDYALWSNQPRGQAAWPRGEPDSAGIPQAIADLVLIAPYNDSATTTQIVEREWRDLAAIIVEPVQRFYAARPEFIGTLRRLCDRFGIALVYDEIVTGFRHALGGAAELTGIAPDLSVFGKALGGGLPLSAVGGSRRFLSHADPHRGGPADGYCYVTSSQAGNPLSCAAALALLDEISQPTTLEVFHARAEQLKAEISKLLLRRGIAAQVVGAGPLWDVAFTQAPITDYRTSLAADAAKLGQFHRALIANGVMVRVGGRSYFSTSHRELEIEQTLKAVDSALRQVH